jgi:hypothetical protein
MPPCKRLPKSGEQLKIVEIPHLELKTFPLPWIKKHLQQDLYHRPHTTSALT